MLYVIFNMTGLTISSNSLLFFLLSEHQSFLEMRSVLDHYELERFFPMVVVSILPHAEFGPNDHREDAPHFTYVQKPISRIPIENLDFSLTKIFSISRMSIESISVL